MNPRNSYLIILFLAGLLSCAKEKCENCTLLETNGSDTTFTAIGEYCDEELERIKTRNYTGPSGQPVYVDCK